MQAALGMRGAVLWPRLGKVSGAAVVLLSGRQGRRLGDVPAKPRAELPVGQV